jgi:hypothetical protein
VKTLEERVTALEARQAAWEEALRRTYAAAGWPPPEFEPAPSLRLVANE